MADKYSVESTFIRVIAKLKKGSAILKAVLVLFLTTGLFTVFQNCSDVRLKDPGGIGEFASTNYPLQLKPPTQYPVIKRYVMLIDMSDSMVQGPCPYDVDVDDSVHGFSGYFPKWDPNPGKGDPNSNIYDHRGVPRDCFVNPSLPIGTMYIDRPSSTNWLLQVNHATYKGSDTEKWRLSVVRKWIADLRSRTVNSVDENVKVLIWPVSGGLPFSRLLQNYPLPKDFVSVNDIRIDQAIGNMTGGRGYLEDIQNAEYEKARMPVVARWLQDLANGNSLLETKMGPTSVGEVLGDIFTPINLDYQSLAYEGLLTGTNYELLWFGDGHITPLQSQFQKVQNMWGGCSCVGAACAMASADCANLYDQMKLSWGDADANTMGSLDVKISALLGLPRYYGGGYFNTQFMHVNPTHFAARASNTGETNIFSALTSTFGSRGIRLKTWKIESATPPYDLVAPKTSISTFKMTHLYILNPNVRIDQRGEMVVDSDADGLSDVEEMAANMDLSKARTNRACLDSIMSNWTFGPYCEALFDAKSCDPTLDSDGDSLNECEELALGTDPYDFDTDGDSIPDSLEWIYGYNPLRDDSKLDSNGDGLANTIHFAAGVPANIDPRLQAKGFKVDIDVDFLGQTTVKDEQIGDVSVDQFNIQLNGLPVARIKPVNPAAQGDLFLARLIANGTNRDNVWIHPAHRLTKSTMGNKQNVLMGLLRTIDPREPERVTWQILELPFNDSMLKMSQQIDLSRFEQMRVMDRNLGGGM